MRRRSRLTGALRSLGRVGALSLLLAAAALPRDAWASAPAQRSVPATPAVAATTPAGGSGSVRATVVLRARHTVQGGQRRKNLRAHPRS